MRHKGGICRTNLLPPAPANWRSLSAAWPGCGISPIGLSRRIGIGSSGSSSFPLVPKLQLGDAAVGEALLRAGEPEGEAELRGQVRPQAGAWERGGDLACGGAVPYKTHPNGISNGNRRHSCFPALQTPPRRIENGATRAWTGAFATTADRKQNDLAPRVSDLVPGVRSGLGRGNDPVPRVTSGLGWRNSGLPAVNDFWLAHRRFSTVSRRFSAARRRLFPTFPSSMSLSRYGGHGLGRGHGLVS